MLRKAVVTFPYFKGKVKTEKVMGQPRLRLYGISIFISANQGFHPRAAAGGHNSLRRGYTVSLLLPTLLMLNHRTIRVCSCKLSIN